MRRTRFTQTMKRSGGSRFWRGRCFVRFKGLVTERSALAYAGRHDDIEAIYKKLSERRDTADVTNLLKELHRVVNESIRTAEVGEDQTEARVYDLSTIDLEKLRGEFAKKVRRKATALKDIRQMVEEKLAQMVANNPLRMDYYKKYCAIVADYNSEKDRVTIEETFAQLAKLAEEMTEEGARGAAGRFKRGGVGVVRFTAAGGFDTGAAGTGKTSEQAAAGVGGGG